MKVKSKLRKLIGILMSCILLVGLLTMTVGAATTYGDNLVQTAWNDWQISSGGYAGNGPDQKTTVSDDGMVRIQKNVVPTDTENEFQVYLSMDIMKKKVSTYESITSMLELDSLYCGGTGNGFPKDNDDVRTGNGSLNNYVQGSEKPITFSEDAPTFTLQIWHDSQLIAEPKLQLVVPNSVLYLKVGTQYIALENIQLQGGQVYIGGQTPTILPDGSYLVPVYLTDMAYEALFNTVINEETEEETVIVLDTPGSASITDPMGSYIVYDGFVNGDISGTPPEAASQAGTTVTWPLDPKAPEDVDMTDPVVTVTEETVIGADGSTYTTRVTTTTQWYLNIAEVVYNVHLDVTKAGFTSGTIYDVNGSTYLSYINGFDENDNPIINTVIFPVPKVLGTLYDFSFQKTDSVTNEGISGAVFVLKDANDNEWAATANGTTDGQWSFTGLPWGTYTLTEVTPPPGYDLPASTTWTLNIGYTEDLKDGVVSDHIHNDNANDVFIGNIEAGATTWFITNTPSDGSLAITKTVTADSGLTAPAADFEIKVTFMQGGSDWDGAANGATYSINGGPELAMPADGVISLKAGETATINNIDSGVTYTVNEQNIPAGFTIASSSGLTGTIVSDTTQQAGITNNYAVDPVTLAEGSIVVNKNLTGTNLSAGAFNFTIVGENDTTPMPDSATATNDADGKVNFGAITYNAPGTYKYTITETDGGLAGYTYDTETVVGVTVTVTDNGDGTMSAIVAYDGGTTFNNTYNASGSIQITAQKKLTGRALEDGQFSFTLTPGDGAPGEVQTRTNNAAGQIVFDAIDFSEVNLAETTSTVNETLTYVMKYRNTTTNEIVDTLPAGAVDNNDGTWTYTDEGSGDTVIFTVCYVNQDDEADLIDTLPEGAVDNNDGTWTYTTYVETTTYGEKTFTYTISEVNAGQAGYTYDDHVETVTVTVKDNGDGTLDVQATYDADGAAFSNRYAAAGDVVIEGSKTLTGRTIVDGQFSFELYDANNNLVETVSNDADGKFAFTALSFDQDDVGEIFTYTIKEVNGGQAGYTYDITVETVTVTVSDKGDGTLNVQATYDADGAAFSNSYAATGSVVIEGLKTLTGRTIAADQFEFELFDENNNSLGTTKNDADGKFAFNSISYNQNDAGKTFTYTIKEVGTAPAGYTYADSQTVTVTVTDNGDGTLTANPTYENGGEAAAFTNTYAATGSVTIEGSKTLTGRTIADGQFSFELYDANNNLVETVSNDADGNFAFTALGFDQDDVGETFTYTIKEVNGGQAGYTYDTANIEIVTVTVGDNGDGTLDVQANYDANGAAFSNSYAATGSVVIEGLKTLTGRKIAANQFEFELFDENNNSLGTTKNDADGKFAFNSISYNQDDAGKTFTYTIKEVGTAPAGYTYANPQTVTVTVTDNGDGTLTANPTYENGEEAAAFTNTYEASGSVTIEGSKTLTGRTIADGQFSFELYDANNSLVETVSNDADGKFSFTALGFDQDDVGETFTYTIKEFNGGQAGYSYDSHVETVTVTVSDNGNGTLDVQATYDADGAAFSNTYKATGSVTIKGSKTLTGRTIADGQFSFELYDANNSLVETVSNDADGKFSFTALGFDQDDVGETFTYTIKEFNGGQAGYSYDSHVETVTVTVSDNGDGTLTATPTYENGEETAAFTNTYEATGSVTIEGSKTLTGRTIADGQFSFELYDANNSLVETVSNDADGKFSFTALGFDQDDVGETFTYTIKEFNGGQAGYSYDSHVETVTVTVSDNGNGTLDVQATYDADGAAFSNTYKATGSVVIEGLKTLTGRTLEADQFTFELYDEDDNLIFGDVKNKADGSFEFLAITYDQNDAGKTFTYTIKEVGTAPAGYTYADPQTVTVTVTDNGDGTLTATPTYENGEEAAAFINTYKASGSVTLEGFKTLKGGLLEDGQFTFKLYDRDNNLIDAATNNAKGNFSFDAIIYNQNDVDKTFTYTIKEVDDGQKDCIYDTHVCKITVKVSDNGDGTLNTDVKYKKDTFVNTLIDPDDPTKPTPKTGDDSNLALWIVMLLASALGVTGGVVYDKRKR